MPRFLDLETWKRKPHFHFFKAFDHPFFNICTDVEVTALVTCCRARRVSFFQATLFLSLRAANELEPFRYRLRGERVLVHDVVHAGSTILNPDETFGFRYFAYHPDFAAFSREASRILADGHAPFNPQDHRDDLIHYSPIPWIALTSFTHARRFGTGDSIPKLVFGRYRRTPSGVQMPVSVEVHHALMDGLHVGRFFERFQTYLNQPDASLGCGGPMPNQPEA